MDMYGPVDGLLRGNVELQNVLQNGDITRIGGELLKEFISDISAGGNMSFAISSSGTVYNWGLVFHQRMKMRLYWEKV